MNDSKYREKSSKSFIDYGYGNEVCCKNKYGRTQQILICGVGII